MFLQTNTVTATIDLYTEEAGVLHDLGLFDGVISSKFVPNLEGNTNREQALKMIGAALKWDVNEQEVSRFPDVSNWAQPCVARAVKLGITNGVGEGKFGGANKVSAREVSTWLLRALGVDNAVAWNETESQLEALGIDIDVSSNMDYTRNLLVKAIFESLKAKPVNEDIILIEKIINGDDGLTTIAKSASLIIESEDKEALITGYNENLTVENYELAVEKFDSLVGLKLTKKEAESFVREIYGTSQYQKDFNMGSYINRQYWKFLGNYSSIISFRVYDEKDYYLNSYSESGLGESIMGITIGNPFSDLQLEEYGFEPTIKVGWTIYEITDIAWINSLIERIEKGEIDGKVLDNSYYVYFNDFKYNLAINYWDGVISSVKIEDYIKAEQ